MGDLLNYKGYTGTIEYSKDDDCLYGKVTGVSVLIQYEGDSLKELRKDFEAGIDDYLADCQEKGVKPEKPYKGSINIRLKSEYHQALDLRARQEGSSINHLINEIVGKALG